jgi:hypothetical protein
VFYRVDRDAVLILGVHDKKTGHLPKEVLKACRARVERYDRESKGEG